MCIYIYIYVPRGLCRELRVREDGAGRARALPARHPAVRRGVGAPGDLLMITIMLIIITITLTAMIMIMIIILIMIWLDI